MCLKSGSYAGGMSSKMQSIRNPCYNVIVESRDSICMTLGSIRSVTRTNPNYIPLPNLENY